MQDQFTLPPPLDEDPSWIAIPLWGQDGKRHMRRYQLGGNILNTRWTE